MIYHCFQLAIPPLAARSISAALYVCMHACMGTCDQCVCVCERESTYWYIQSAESDQGRGLEVIPLSFFLLSLAFVSWEQEEEEERALLMCME